ncbi:MAG: hypothetical protein ACXACA_09010 [Candidatus Ranarchaeia archaeon]|jgi:flavin-dependent dehydrogenase
MESSTENWHAHSVLTCGPVSKTFLPYAISVGDAAGQVKQTTGGGVVMGGLCAQIAANTLSDNLKKKVNAISDLSSYQKEWQTLLKDEFKSMRFARWVSNSLSDKALANLFSALKKYEDEITKKGDMDFQSGVINALRSKPRLLLTGMKEIIHDVFRR